LRDSSLTTVGTGMHNGTDVSFMATTGIKTQA